MALRLGKTTISHFLSQVAVSVAGFVSTFAIARVLGAEGVGAYALGITVLTWVRIPIIGIGTAQIQRMSGSSEEGEFLTSALVTRLGFSIAVASILLLLEGQINGYVGADVAQLLALILIVDVLFGTFGAALQSQKRVDHYGWIKAFENVTRTGAQVILIITGAGVTGLFLGHAAASAVAAVLGVALLSVRFSKPNVKHIRSLLSYAKYAWSGGLKGKTFGWTDTLILGFFVTTSLIGIYEVAWTLASFLVLVSNSISSTLFPEISELGTENRNQKIHHYLNEAFVFTGVFLIPGFFGAIAIGDDLLQIYSPEFAKGSTVLLILIASRGLDAYGSQMVSAVKALNRPDLAFRVDLSFVIVNVVMNAALISIYGWYGAAVATFLSGSITLILSYWLLTQLIGAPDIPYGEIGREIFASVVMFCILILLERSFTSSHLITLLLVFTGAVIYASVLYSASHRIRQKTKALFS